MNRRTFRRLPSALLLLTLSLAVGLVPEFAGSSPVAAQSSQPVGIYTTCGTVTAFTAPTASAAGTITIAGQTTALPTSLAQFGVGGAALATGTAPVCFIYDVGPTGIDFAELVTIPTGMQAVCGTLGAFTASGTAAGSVTVGAATIFLPVGTTINNTAIATTGANVCFEFTVSSAGAITNAIFVANASIPVTICGSVTAYTAATSSGAGSLVIGGVTIPLPVGSVFVPTAQAPTVGQTQTVSITLNAAGQVVSLTTAAGSCATTTITGTPTASIPATATTAGSITFGAAVFTIAAGSNVILPGSVPLAAIAVARSGSPARLHLARGG